MVDPNHQGGGQSKLNWGERTEVLVYKWFQLSSWLKLIPFTVHVEESRGAEEKFKTRSQNSNGKQQGESQSHRWPSAMTDQHQQRERERDGHVPRKMYMKFKDGSSNMWAYRVMMIVFLTGNVSRFYFFFKGLATTKTFKIDVIFAADMYFFSAIIFSTVFKTAVWFCPNDLIFLLNEVDDSVARMRLGLRLLMNKTNKNGHTIMVAGVNQDRAEGIEDAEKKYCWFSTKEGLMGAWSSAFTGTAAYLATTALMLYGVEWRKLKTFWDFVWVAVDSILGTIVAFMTCLQSITSCFIIIIIILSAKIQLLWFNQLEQIEGMLDDLSTRNEDSVQKMEKLLRRYRKLQVFNDYGNGYFRVLFPGYIGVSQCIMISLFYVALTGYSYLPILIYATFPMASVFVFCILILLFMSQVGNIFRQSQLVCLDLRLQFGLQFTSSSSSTVSDHGVNKMNLNMDNGIDNGSVASSMTIMGGRMENGLFRRIAEIRYIQKSLRTTRPFGFYSGFYGSIDQKTPASMTENICNCLILLLNLSHTK